MAAKRGAAKKAVAKRPAKKKGPSGRARRVARRASARKAKAQAPTGEWRPGDWVHVEIPVADRDKAKAFYGQVFGWTFQDAPGMGYTLYSTHEGAVGGGLFTPPPEVPKHGVINYLLVNEIDPVVARIVKAGGRLVNPTMEVKGAGWFALVADPDGNVFGLWKAAARP